MPGKAEMKLGLNCALIKSGISLKLSRFLAYRAQLSPGVWLWPNSGQLTYRLSSTMVQL